VETWKKVIISILITVVIGGIYLLTVWRQRHNPGVIVQTDANQSLSQDDLAVVRSFFPTTFEDTLRLEGTTVWMKNGYTMPYFPYAGGRVEFGKRVGVIPSLRQLAIKKVVKAVVPANVDDGISHGSKQALAVFALPGGPDLYATAIGAIDRAEESYYPDMLFFYDDPHTIYDRWSKDVWAAIDAHQVKPGMSELETRLSIGQKEHPDGATEGDRTVTYDQDGKHWSVTYVGKKATAIKNE
jgi:hypothetical protein